MRNRISGGLPFFKGSNSKVESSMQSYRFVYVFALAWSGATCVCIIITDIITIIQTCIRKTSFSLSASATPFTSIVLDCDNIALHKPAFQSSAWSSSFSTVPGNVVDGNLDRDINNGHCTGTLEEDLNPWWMVDLGKPFKIHNVTIVNRGDWKKDYLHDFYIEMFLLHPVTWNSITPQQCLFYDGILYDVETLTCDVAVTGRYVRIRKVPRPGKVSLTLCEVEIRGMEAQKQECGSNELPSFGGQILQTSSKEVVASDSLLACHSRCYEDLYCYDINYSSLTQICEMILTRSDTDTLLDDQEWTFVSLP